MLHNLIDNKLVNVIDGDNRLDDVTGDLKNELQNLVDNGLNFKPIQVFHYASVHYNTRWGNYPMRFINALVNSMSSIDKSRGIFCLNDSEESELQGQSSEILSLGLSTMFMSRWFSVNINRFEKILETGKRCDYRFIYNGMWIIFEAKGRKYKSDIKKALIDSQNKKTYHTGDYMYSLISHLPRDKSCVCLYIYDPPTDKNYILENENLALLKHYARLTERVGLTELSKEINKRIILWIKESDWIESPIESNVSKIGTNTIVNNQSYWSRNLPVQNYDSPLNLNFGLNEKVINYLVDWDINALKNYYEEAFVVSTESKIISVIEDGSMMVLNV